LLRYLKLDSVLKNLTHTQKGRRGRRK